MAVGRIAAAVIGLLLQIVVFVIINLFFAEHIVLIDLIYTIGGLLLALYLIRKSKNYSYTMPWIILLLIFPLVGALLYIVLGQNKKHSKTLRNVTAQEKISSRYLEQDKSVKLSNNGRLKYISEFSGYPVTCNNDVSYYPLGDEAFPAILEELKKAKKFIFLEYFIVNHGKMWNSMLKILEQKAKEGVEVRMMYDDFGCVALLDKNYPKKLEEKGIKCIQFNRLNAFVGIIMNNRDHRKILVIDGRVAFTGGINLADEYINIGSKYGHWKDNAIKISGDAVWSYTVMFLTMWNSVCHEDEDYSKFKYEFKNRKADKGYVAPYADSPIDEEITGEDVYLNIINQAQDYIYIMTPYLIIDTEMISALSRAAKRGVDVKIIIPGIPDKKIVYTLSESYIEPLASSGVKVYTDKPGFIHAKVFVADDHIATVGTINLDYRSLYLHFECGCYMEDAPVVKAVKKDVVNTLSKSREVTPEESAAGFWKGVWQSILRLVSPLL